MLLKFLGGIFDIKDIVSFKAAAAAAKLFILNSNYDAQPQAEQRNFPWPLSNLWELESLAI